MPVIHSTPQQVPALISANPIFGGQPASRASQRRLRLSFGTSLWGSPISGGAGLCCQLQPFNGTFCCRKALRWPRETQGTGLLWAFLLLCKEERLSLGRDSGGLSLGNRHRPWAGDAQDLLPRPLLGVLEEPSSLCRQQ